MTMAMPGADLFLADKIGVRARGARLVERARLRALLESAPEARLLLVAAPAGFGKTTLLATWAGEADVRSAWLSLDPRDNDVVRFVRYLATAASLLTGRIEEIPERDPSQPLDPELALASILDPVAAALADGTAGEVVLVLDDYHVIDERGDPSARRVARRAAPGRGAVGDRNARRPAAAAGPAPSAGRAARGAGRRSPLHRARGWRAAPRGGGGARPRGRRRARRAHRRLGGGAAPGRDLPARAVRPGRAGAAIRCQPPLRPRLRGGGGACRPAVGDAGLPPADVSPRPPVRVDLRCRHRMCRRPGSARGARARKPPDRPARRRAAVVPLPRVVRGGPSRPAADPPPRRAPGSPCAGRRPGLAHSGDDDEAIAHALRADDLERTCAHGGGGFAALAQRRGAQHRPPVARRSPWRGRTRRPAAQHLVRVVPRPPGRDRRRGPAAGRRRARPRGRPRR